MTFRVHHLTESDLTCPDRGEPSFSTETGAWKRTTKVHARPMYRHDPALVEEVLRHCERAYPLHDSVAQNLTTIDREFESGFNGYAFKDHNYYGDVAKVRAGNMDGGVSDYSQLCVSILLSGKQVPPLPAWTRYLVAHEYGHCAWYCAEQFLGYVDRGGQEAELEYMRMRGHPDWRDGRMWHQRAVEVIANDFRIVVAAVEVDFWQHDVPHPDGVPQVAAWWKEVAPRIAGGLPSVA